MPTYNDGDESPATSREEDDDSDDRSSNEMSMGRALTTVRGGRHSTAARRDAPSSDRSSSNAEGLSLSHDGNDRTKGTAKFGIPPPPGFHFDPIVRRTGALVNRQSMGMHRQNREQHQHRGAASTTEEGILNSQQRDDSDAAAINSFTFGFNILGLGLLDDSPRVNGLAFPS